MSRPLNFSLFHTNGSLVTYIPEKTESFASLFATNSTLDGKRLSPPKIIFRPQVIKGR